MQTLVCFIIQDAPVFNFLGAGICFVDIWENPLLAFCFGLVYEAFVLYHLVRRRVSLSQKRDKVLRGVLDKVRYVCEDLDDGTMYLRARVNYDLAIITVDVYRSKPPTAQKQQKIPDQNNDGSDSPIIEVV